jgi:hypothetical protein
MDAFRDQAHAATAHIPSKYQTEMGMKSVTVSLLVQYLT